MIRLLGIDYGRKNIGLAIATTMLAEPLQYLDNTDAFIPELKKIIKAEKITHLIIGLSEGDMAQEIKDFASKIKQVIDIPQHFQDETLTSLETKSKLFHKKRHHRSQPQDAYQAAAILQDYIDTHPSTQSSKS